MDARMFAFQFDRLNRQGELRHDEQLFAKLLQQDDTLFLPLYKQFLAINDQGLIWLKLSEIQQLTGTLSKIHCIYLGLIDGKNYFAYRLQSSEQLRTLSNLTSDLRTLLPQLNEQEAYLANVATALNQWHSSHQHCGYCGHETFATDSGFVRQCSNQDCTKQHFPRTDPAIIVAISHTDATGTAKLLLGRQANWPEKRFSVIAGFVEPGESLEQAVKREALEEIGIDICDIEYQNSQPWPFPQSVMLGFTAKAKTVDIQLKDQELETANWFSKKEIQQLVKDEKMILPFKFSISRMLVEQWLNKN